jgi:hypothetical protein
MKLEQVIHMYLGYQFISVYPTNPQSPETLTCDWIKKILACDRDCFTYHPKWTRLVLRKLEDMTEEEIIKLSEIKNKWGEYSIRGEAEKTAYLISIGMDVFDLIYNKLAIDKSTL